MKTVPPFPDTWVRQTIDNLRDDITKSELERMQSGYSSRIVEVIDPGEGVFGPAQDGLIDIVYQCNDRNPKRPYADDPNFVLNPCTGFKRGEHTHEATYGPRIIRFSDACKNHSESKSKWHHQCDNYEPLGYEVVDWEHFELYAD